MMKRVVGWTLLISGGIGIIISAIIGSDWPMYAFIIIAGAGSVILITRLSNKDKPVTFNK